MQFIKKHYEKVLLSIVLLGLALAAAWLPWQVAHERERLEEIGRNLTVKVKAKPFKPLDAWLTTNKAALARLETPLNLELSGPHNLFNPVQWKKMTDGRLIPIRTGSEWGPLALKVLNIRELMMTVSFPGVQTNSPGETANPNEPPKYQINILNEAERNHRELKVVFSPTLPHLERFDLVSIQGPTNDPTGLVLRLRHETEPITVLKDKPFQRVEGYEADLEYPPAKQQTKMANKRKGDEIKLEGDPEHYKIVAITQDEVVLSADSNKKHIRLKYNARTTASTNSP
jgi:hypothetical protein